MTRTMLNWSELLEKYRGMNIEKDHDLKKWSEMGNPELLKKVLFNDDAQNKVNMNEDYIDQEFYSSSIQNPNVVPIEPIEPNNESTQLDLGLSLAQLFYDTVLLDNKTIPAMYVENKQKQMNKLSEQDLMLIELLETRKERHKKS